MSEVFVSERVAVVIISTTSGIHVGLQVAESNLSIHLICYFTSMFNFDSWIKSCICFWSHQHKLQVCWAHCLKVAEHELKSYKLAHRISLFATRGCHHCPVSSMDLSAFYNIVAGERRGSENNTTPRTAASLPVCPMATASDVEDSVAAAQKAFPAWAGQSYETRTKLLEKFADLYLSHGQEFCTLLAAETGRTVRTNRRITN